MAIDRDLTRIIDGKNPYRARVRTLRKRTAGQREADLVFIADLYLKGFSHQQITDELNNARVGMYQIAVATVNQDLDIIHARWIASYLVDFDRAKARELAHIDALEQEYWQAWKRSQQKREEVESEQIKDVQGRGDNRNTPQYSRTRVKKKEEQRDGENKFLAGIQWCIEQRCKIFGLNASTTTQNINVNWRKEAVAQGIDPDGVTNELVEQFLNAAAAKTPLAGSGNTGGVGPGTEDPS